MMLYEEEKDEYEIMIAKAIRRFQSFITADEDDKVLSDYNDIQKRNSSNKKRYQKCEADENTKKYMREVKSSNGVDIGFVGKTTDFTKYVNKNMNIKVVHNKNIVMMEAEPQELSKFSKDESLYVIEGVPYILVTNELINGNYREYYVRKDLVIAEILCFGEFLENAEEETNIINLDRDMKYIQDSYINIESGEYYIYGFIFNIRLDDFGKPYHTITNHQINYEKCSKQFIEKYMKMNRLCVAKGCEYLVTGEIK